MKRILVVLLWALSLNAFSQSVALSCCTEVKTAGRCSGDAYCSACSSCNYCGHCNSGGSCGVCYTPPPKKAKKVVVKRQPAKVKAKSKKAGKVTVAQRVYPDERRLVVLSETLEVWSRPMTDYSTVLEIIFKNDEVIYLDATGDWFKVQVLESGTVGFARADFLGGG